MTKEFKDPKVSQTQEFFDMVRKTGFGDCWYGVRHRCPGYWRNTPEEKIWKEGYNKAKNILRGNKKNG